MEFLFGVLFSVKSGENFYCKVEIFVDFVKINININFSQNSLKQKFIYPNNYAN